MKQATIEDEQQMARVLVIFSSLVHAYVRGGLTEKTINTIPNKLAEPFKMAAQVLGLKPIACYNSTVLFNWELFDPTGPLDLENMRCINTITGSPDESWFYLVCVAIEGKGGEILGCMLSIQQSCEQSNLVEARTGLDTFATIIDSLVPIIDRMYENNLPSAFYTRVRRYLSGWTNDSDLPEGLHYGSGNPGEFYVGASAAQSPTIQVLDVALGILHPTMDKSGIVGETRVGVPGKYLMEMRQYMIKNHRECLEWLQANLTIRQFAMDHPELHASYNKCLEAFERFRTAHVKMVSFYVVCQAAKENKEIQGTGGSNPIPLLKDIRAHLAKHRL